VDLLEILKVADALGVALVLGWMLRWSLKKQDEKDRVIVDIATRSSKALEAALERRDDG
jgi:hypothetical protein